MIKEEKISVFIVDDDNVLADGVAKFFKESTSFKYLDRANDPEECLKKLRQCIHKIDIILMDTHLPKYKTDGIQLARKIRAVYPGKKPRIAFMAICNKALVDPDNGFYGLIPKNQGIKELMDMLKEIYYNDAIYYPREFANKHFIDKLTAKQKRIFCKIIKGYEVEEIAEHLNVSSHTVNFQHRVILSKIHQFGMSIDQIKHPKILEFVQLHKLCDQL